MFDEKLIAAHLQRAQKNWLSHDFLAQRIAAQLQERLRDVKRDFVDAVEIGVTPLVLTQEVRREKRVTHFAHLAPLHGWGAAHTVVTPSELIPLARHTADLIVSLNHLHWVHDVPGVLAQIQNALRPDGLLLFAMIGGESLHELRHALFLAETELRGGVSPRVAPFATLHDIAALLQRTNFALPVVDHETLTITYKDIFSLVRELRGMGQTNAIKMRDPRIVPRNFWPTVEKHYRAAFATKDDRLPVTVEILYGLGWAPHQSQQQPLKRGSAVVRLADALRTAEYSAGEQTPRDEGR